MKIPNLKLPYENMIDSACKNKFTFQRKNSGVSVQGCNMFWLLVLVFIFLVQGVDATNQDQSQDNYFVDEEND